MIPAEVEDVVQVVMTTTVFEHYKAWLRVRGLELARTQFDPEDIPTYSVVIK